MSCNSQGQKRLEQFLKQLCVDPPAPWYRRHQCIKNNTSNNKNQDRNEVSIVSDLSQIYDSSSLSMQKSRYVSLISRFSRIYNGAKPDFIIRAPGRVNIIGEHIDYCGYDVLPMTVEKDILFLCKIDRNSRLISLTNTDRKFAPVTLNLSNKSDITIDVKKKHRQWSDYFLAGLSGVCKEYSNNNVNILTTNGLRILVDGTLPQGSGLSSSSAFVCGSAVSLLFSNKSRLNNENSINRIRFLRSKIAETCIECERNVGVDSGGMDQTICMMAEKGYAKHVSFIPKLKATSVKLPDSSKYCFIISNCLKEHKLMENAGTQNYNTRVVECRLATLILAKKLGLANWRAMRTMRNVQDATGLSLKDMINCTLNHLNKNAYSLSSIENELGIANNNNPQLEDFMVGLKTGVTVVKNLRNLDYKLPLQLRMLHVYSEAQRVLEFARICNENSSKNNNGSSYSVAKQLGELMCDSHKSCSEMYECSCLELDKLQSICMKGGALGSRLTGAGWGGCVVSFIEKSKVDGFRQYVKQSYYSQINNVPQNAMFETTPSSSLTICTNLNL